MIFAAICEKKQKVIFLRFLLLLFAQFVKNLLIFYIALKEVVFFIFLSFCRSGGATLARHQPPASRIFPHYSLVTSRWQIVTSH